MRKRIWLICCVGNQALKRTAEHFEIVLLAFRFCGLLKDRNHFNAIPKYSQKTARSLRVKVRLFHPRSSAEQVKCCRSSSQGVNPLAKRLLRADTK